MGLLARFQDATRRRKSRDFAKELSNHFFLSPLCSDYENLFAQVRPLIDEMKVVMPYGVTDRGTKLPSARTPELEWLKNPNDEMGWAEFADLMFATWLTEEELDIHVWKDRRGKVIGYTILPPQSRIYYGYGRYEWQVMTTEGLEVLTENDVMRLRFSRSPRNAQKGVSPASAVRVWAQIDDLIAQYQKAYFENGAIPATITFITASTKEKYEDTRRELENNLKGARNRNKTVYAWRQFDNDEGKSIDQVEVKTIQGNNSTLAIREIVDIVNDRLNKSIGVSNFILGDDSSAKYDNAELSDHQFTKRRVYPALVSFWNQFQHELDRITDGLGYGISFDLEIPELTERVKARAEIARIRAESLVNLISAGSTGASAVKALGLPDAWLNTANDIYNKGLVGELNSPIAIDYKASEPTKPTEATVDEAKPLPKAPKADAKEAKCTCHHSIDKLPPMTKEEQKLYNILVKYAEQLVENPDMTLNADKLTEDMVQLLVEDAKQGKIDGAKAIELLQKGDVANEIAKTITNGDIFVSKSLTKRITSRAGKLAKGYSAYTQGVVLETLAGNENLSASEIKSKLQEVMPRERAEMIARNETLYAIRSGRLEEDQELAKKYDLKIKLIWRTSGDSDVCAVCASMEGKETILGDAFHNHHIAGESLTKEQLEKYKLKATDELVWEHTSWNDKGKSPDAHVNCRCYFEEVLA